MIYPLPKIVLIDDRDPKPLYVHTYGLNRIRGV